MVILPNLQCNYDKIGLQTVIYVVVFRKNHQYPIFFEVNRDEVYEGAPMVEELDEFLGTYGFVRVETKWPETHYTWGDALYIKNKGE